MFPPPKSGGDMFVGLKVQSAGVTAESLQAAKLEANQKQTTYNLAVCCIVLFCAEASRGLFMSGRTNKRDQTHARVTSAP